LRCGVGQAVEPGVHRVCEPDCACFVDKDIVDAVEVVAEVIVQERHSLVGVWVKCPDASTLLGTTNRIIATGGRLKLLVQFS
jgi:hypothetical protein